jgi:hypothetical protein
MHLFSIALLIFVFVALLGNKVAFAAGEPKTQAAGQPALDKPAELNPGASLATTPVEFTIAGTVYRVPRNYLITMSNWTGGPQEFVTMRVNGPHLTPLTEATRQCLSGDRFALSAEIMIGPASRIGCMPFEFDLADPDGREASGVTAEREIEKIRPLARAKEPWSVPPASRNTSLSSTMPGWRLIGKSRVGACCFTCAPSPTTVVGVMVFVVP